MNGSLTYRACVSQISRGTYGTKEAMMEKLDLFLLGNRITAAEYEELVSLLNEKEAQRNQ